MLLHNCYPLIRLASPMVDNEVKFFSDFDSRVTNGRKTGMSGKGFSAAASAGAHTG